MKHKVIFASLLILFFCFAAHAQTKKFSVALIITGDKQLESETKSYLSRELWSLGDVEVGDNGTFAISVNIIKSKIKGGSEIGYVLSIAFVKFVACGGAEYGDFLGNWVAVGSLEDLRGICEDVVTSFDTTVLNNYRKTESKQKVMNDDSPFTSEYVGGNVLPSVIIKNESNIALNLTFGKSLFVIPGKTEKTLTLDEGTYNFTAAAPGVRSLTGSHNFERGYRYSWSFFTIRVK